MEPILNLIPNQISFDQYIHEKRLKLREVAEALGISTQGVWAIRKEKVSPSLKLARKIYDWSDGRVNFLVDVDVDGVML